MLFETTEVQRNLDELSRVARRIGERGGTTCVDQPGTGGLAGVAAILTVVRGHEQRIDELRRVGVSKR